MHHLLACSNACCAGGGVAPAGSEGAGSSTAAGSSGAAEVGMVLFLSQIQEWIVEFSCDLLFISIRTDVAWYRLSR